MVGEEKEGLGRKGEGRKKKGTEGGKRISVSEGALLRLASVLPKTATARTRNSRPIPVYTKRVTQYSVQCSVRPTSQVSSKLSAMKLSRFIQ